jgi:hypothetical protein
MQQDHWTCDCTAAFHAGHPSTDMENLLGHTKLHYSVNGKEL